jgi:alpha-D-ribose 1-methylphosphonate 5-triphosphate diphosphatase PhnM
MAIDAGCFLVLPGIVDLHGDAFERQLMPRPGAHFAPVPALLETDRQLLANGITTAYHGVTLSWEPGLRGIEAAREFLAALSAARPRLGADTSLHLRFECLNLDAVEEVVSWIEAGRIDLLAFNDNTGDTAPGRRADLILVDDSGPTLPRVVASYVLPASFVSRRYPSTRMTAIGFSLGTTDSVTTLHDPDGASFARSVVSPPG